MLVFICSCRSELLQIIEVTLNEKIFLNGVSHLKTLVKNVVCTDRTKHINIDHSPHKIESTKLRDFTDQQRCEKMIHIY